MTDLHWKDIKESIAYDGSQLSRVWVEEYSQASHVIASFTGPCDVDKKFMVDLEDLAMGCRIASNNMLHFILYLKSFLLPGTVFVQRLFVILIKEVLAGYGVEVRRSGNDLFYQGGKLNISVATESLDKSGGLIHVALNITTEGTPDDVNTASLEGLKISPGEFKEKVIQSFFDEWNDIIKDSNKVKRV